MHCEYVLMCIRLFLPDRVADFRAPSVPRIPAPRGGIVSTRGRTGARTVDHVFPRSRGGGDTYDNLVAACADCNGRKADRTPEEAGMPLLWIPRAPREDLKRQRAIWRDLTPTA
ncbi:HNH endonuclease [Rhodococcus sp. AG1013]|nr:HNH endonuclease [Rhodococcus sp. AG1013]